MAIELVQGESRDLVFTATALTGLPDTHPLKVLGLQTPGYQVLFYAKLRLDDTDAAAAIAKSSATGGVVVESATMARVILTPTDTGAIAIPSGKRAIALYGGIRVRNTAGTIVYYPAYLERIELLNAV